MFLAFLDHEVERMRLGLITRSKQILCLFFLNFLKQRFVDIFLDIYF